MIRKVIGCSSNECDFEVLVAAYERHYRCTTATAMQKITAAFPDSHRAWLAGKQKTETAESHEMPEAARNYANTVAKIQADSKCSRAEAQLAAQAVDPQGYQTWLIFHQPVRPGHLVH